MRALDSARGTSCSGDEDGSALVPSRLVPGGARHVARRVRRDGRTAFLSATQSLHVDVVFAAGFGARVLGEHHGRECAHLYRRGRALTPENPVVCAFGRGLFRARSRNVCDKFESPGSVLR